MLHYCRDRVYRIPVFSYIVLVVITRRSAIRSLKKLFFLDQTPCLFIWINSVRIQMCLTQAERHVSWAES